MWDVGFVLCRGEDGCLLVVKHLVVLVWSLGGDLFDIFGVTRRGPKGVE